MAQYHKVTIMLFYPWFELANEFITRQNFPYLKIIVNITFYISSITSPNKTSFIFHYFLIKTRDSSSPMYSLFLLCIGTPNCIIKTF